jgi:glucosamine--fructose-6-phosphate aminotransferase (isomerizing)
MCGIIGYVGNEQAAPILEVGLERLTYRGYDSAGIAVLDGARLSLIKRAGKLSVLLSALDSGRPAGACGIGHTRWATHGGVTDANAHPHLDCGGDVAVVHNGIIENYVALRLELQARGHRFASETDSEVLSHLIEQYLADGASLVEAVRATANRLAGAAAIVALARREPGVLVGARVGNAGAVVVGYGDNEMLLASDLPALLHRTRRVVFLDAGEVAKVTPRGAAFFALNGERRDRAPTTVPYNTTTVDKGAYKHYMLKEIHEQPAALLDTIRGHVDPAGNGVAPAGTGLDPARIDALQRVVLVGMGTSLHAAMVGRAYIERLAGLPAEVENASEFRYREPLIGPETLVVSVSQSGETVDTLAAMETARRCGAPQITVCNVAGAQTTRTADGIMLTCCGPEIGVASTKTFTASMAALYLLAVWLGQRRNFLAADEAHRAIDDLCQVPALVARLCEQAQRRESAYHRLAGKYGHAQHMLFLGRALAYPLALEGALKMKEIAYLHAEGYPAGEIKHGPIALVERATPSVVLAPRDPLFATTVATIQQVQARGGPVIAVGVEGDEELAGLAHDVLVVPPTRALLSPFVLAIPLQLLAYQVAVYRGTDVDQPRNLAKTVTVY